MIRCLSYSLGFYTYNSIEKLNNAPSYDLINNEIRWYSLGNHLGKQLGLSFSYENNTQTWYWSCIVLGELYIKKSLFFFELFDAWILFINLIILNESEGKILPENIF